MQTVTVSEYVSRMLCVCILALLCVKGYFCYEVKVVPIAHNGWVEKWLLES